ncbi:riboflavin synthase alpha chain [Chitinophaga costaii]|uniref:Riboflavin synthase n=1 Tax=Chitinophaga costaii TaxID=1335309 RepID=A0A1C3ZPW6_9BACT|nr:riboflavin synthase [Chitinophaga costaii]PUZ30457.1 riboflavin synthase [Chitinophaga costaii]SCB84302.1 riboflavin synthase alpha chain [Chitinophaga costaii]
MFTGIIETTGTVTQAARQGSNLKFTIQTPLAAELKIDQSVSHNGVCLTVTRQDAATFDVVAIDETLQKTNLGQLKPGAAVNLERAMVFNGRIDGHLVQGHVDGTGTCLSVTAQDGSWVYRIGFATQFAALVVEKGSICLNGISLTVFNVRDDEFTVAIIPYTYEHTNIQHLQAGDTVNLEFDILGKFVARHMDLRN